MRMDMTRAEELAFASPLKLVSNPSNSGGGVVSQPSVTTEIDIYDATAQADLETSLRNAPPMRIVMGQPWRHAELRCGGYQRERLDQWQLHPWPEQYRQHQCAGLGWPARRT